MTMNPYFPINHTTLQRRRLQAQKNYIQLIHSGVFHHDLTKAYEVLKSLQAPAILEAINNHFVR
jgi:hypothetical protein